MIIIYYHDVSRLNATRRWVGRQLVGWWWLVARDVIYTDWMAHISLYFHNGFRHEATIFYWSHLYDVIFHFLYMHHLYQTVRPSRCLLRARNQPEPKRGAGWIETPRGVGCKVIDMFWNSDNLSGGSEYLGILWLVQCFYFLSLVGFCLSKWVIMMILVREAKSSLCFC